MHVNTGIWDKLTRLVIFLLFIAGLLVVAVWYLPLIRQNERMRKEIIRYDHQIDRQKEVNKQYRDEIEALSHDTKAVERLARQSLGYARPDESVIRFEAQGTNRPSGR